VTPRGRAAPASVAAGVVSGAAAMARQRNDLGAVERPAVSIVHDIPGRLRLRLPNVPAVEDLVRELTAVPGIVECAWSPRTGSLRIHYDRAVITPGTIVEWVASRAAVAGPEPERAPAPAAASTRASFGTAVKTAMTEVNQRVSRVTGGTFDLPGLLVVSLVVWAAREIVRGRVAPLAWSTALWYANGLFHDYHIGPDRPIGADRE
jgi:Heavy metal associated domain 2